MIGFAPGAAAVPINPSIVLRRATISGTDEVKGAAHCVSRLTLVEVVR